MHKKFKKTNNEYNLFSLKLQQKQVNFMKLLRNQVNFYEIITKSGQILQNYYEIRSIFTKLLRNQAKFYKINFNFTKL